MPIRYPLVESVYKSTYNVASFNLDLISLMGTNNLIRVIVTIFPLNIAISVL
jgi:hypothetical protein